MLLEPIPLANRLLLPWLHLIVTVSSQLRSVPLFLSIEGGYFLAHVRARRSLTGIIKVVY